MGSLIDLTGNRYGRLLVIEKAGRERTNVMWKCVCDCGNVRRVLGTMLRGGQTKSCGCLRRDASKERMRVIVMTRRLTGTNRVERAFDDVFGDEEAPIPDTPPKTFPGCEQALADLNTAWVWR